MFSIRLTGDWCSGIWWQIIDHDTSRVVCESGPYHRSDGREIAFDDAVDYAQRNDIPLDTTVNFHRGVD